MSFTESGEGVFIHPHALCESESVGEGTRIWAFCHVMAGAVVGRDCNLCGHTFIEAGAVVGDGVTVKNGVEVWDGVVLERNVFVGPNATFTNDLRPRAAQPLSPADFVPTKVEEGASLGANVTVVCGHTIGRHAFVAAGAVVTEPVSYNHPISSLRGRRL